MLLKSHRCFQASRRVGSIILPELWQSAAVCEKKRNKRNFTASAANSLILRITLINPSTWKKKKKKKKEQLEISCYSATFTNHPSTNCNQSNPNFSLITRSSQRSFRAVSTRHYARISTDKPVILRFPRTNRVYFLSKIFREAIATRR